MFLSFNFGVFLPYAVIALMGLCIFGLVGYLIALYKLNGLRSLIDNIFLGILLSFMFIVLDGTTQVRIISGLILITAFLGDLYGTQFGEKDYLYYQKLEKEEVNIKTVREYILDLLIICFAFLFAVHHFVTVKIKQYFVFISTFELDRPRPP